VAQATRRTLTAAARAAAKRAERAETHQVRDIPEETGASGRTVVVEAPDGWDDPPEPRAESEEPDPPRRLPGRLRTAILSVVLVAGLTAVGVLGWQYREARATEQARVQALAAARTAAPVVLSYDHRHLDRDFARARALLTGKFREEYGRTTKTVVGPTAKKYEGVVKASVVRPPGGGAPAASVVSASPDRAVVLLFVNQVTESTQVTGSRVDLNRVRMTVDRTPDGWKVSAVDAL
jgi:Mce-associated membrane protein